MPSTGRPRRRWRPSCRACSRRSSPSRTGWPVRRPACPRHERRWTTPARRWPPRSPITGPPSAPSTSPSTISSGSASGIPVYEVLGLSRRHPADRLHDRDRPTLARRRASGPGGPFPGAQDQGGRSGRRRDPGRGPGRLRRPDPGRREHRLDARGREGDAARPSSSYGVELIEQPFPARRLDDLAALQAESPLPIVADESAVTIDDLDGLVGVVAGVNVKLAKCGGVGPAARMLGPRPRARLPDVPRLHGGDVGRDRRIGGRRGRSRNGSISTATCSSPRTRSRASSSAPTAAGGCPTGPASG